MVPPYFFTCLIRGGTCTSSDLSLAMDWGTVLRCYRYVNGCNRECWGTRLDMLEGPTAVETHMSQQIRGGLGTHKRCDICMQTSSLVF